LTQDRGSHNFVPVLSTNKISRFQKDSSPVIPWHAFPFCLGSESAIDGGSYGCLIRFMVYAQMIGVIGRYRLLSSFTCLYLLAGFKGCNQNRELKITYRLAVHDARNFKRKVLLHLSECCHQCIAFW
jgi:hypothetical protein